MDVSLLLLCVLCALPFSAAFSWSSCSQNPADDVIEVKELKLTPDILSLDGSVTLSAKVDVKRDLNGLLRVQTEIEKTSGLFGGQKIPCQGKFGSCTYEDACSKFDKLCPVTAGMHTVPEYTIKLPPMSAIIRLMAEGQYSGKIIITDGDGTRLGCVSLSLQVVS